MNDIHFMIYSWVIGPSLLNIRFYHFFIRLFKLSGYVLHSLEENATDRIVTHVNHKFWKVKRKENDDKTKTGFTCEPVIVNILVWWSLQDWDFPHFVNNFDIKLPGLNIAHFKFHIPNCAKRYSEDWYVHVSGK